MRIRFDLKNGSLRNPLRLRTRGNPDVGQRRMIHKLLNPNTSAYRMLKEQVLGNKFPWFYYAGDDATPPYYGHTVLTRPGFDGMLMSTSSSEYLHHCNEVLSEIFKHNKIEVNVVHRINLNCTHWAAKNSPIHADHDFPHQNLIVYLNEFDGGRTTVYKGDVSISHKPHEDDIIMFSGLHNVVPPHPSYRRIVLVATFT